ncbi:hypothetical protein GCM10009837_32740 [Streptomyces durmitorensis]|uniref:DUF2812 domain-containing protein n=1 Tax=Streptomyces durmitorensis TaxID=319947 RepID=A0ABY4Q2A4_9ACTN|nr:hypothetical protein [Streptomyces durmitorensis]UQT59322.1 hypothetical protein M4V62_32020 [Streptomyces durmitorensis]
MSYFEDLAALLRQEGVPSDRVEATVADLAAHLEESGGADPEAEFGPVDEFARELVPAGGQEPEVPEAHVETWRWTADTYVDEELLNRFGGEGWEVERVDALGRFVSHRDLERPQRWEYRRELVTRGREGLDERLAPEGWEACGNWIVYAWFKRPLAASLGPGAEISAPPGVPGRWRFFSRRFYVLAGVAALAVVLAGVAVAVDDGDADSGFGFAGGLFVGALVPLAAVWGLQVWRSRR